jgi:hypothetical protein
VPFYGHGFEPADPAWGVAYPSLVNDLYNYYGDTRIIEQHVVICFLSRMNE